MKAFRGGIMCTRADNRNRSVDSDPQFLNHLILRSVGSLVADCGSDESVSEVEDGAASIGTPNGLGSSDDDDEDDGNPDLQIGMTALVGGDDSVPKRLRRGKALEVTESEVEREQTELREMMSRNPIWQLQNQEFQSDDEDDQDFDPTVDVSDDDALSGLVSEDDVI
ncbi:U1 small nuclear ribonucleoprotein 70 kDa [Perkinsus olseni]|uniref:U1 small nuclear ribonucleoprotein 70 kDa n=1 Tax=Perkinsus olseni TaxID=32597 RepID=A0A7J6QYB4_PEROL|nr:U1 small nuclear ribonucleoprotein 70 kDa [Perkinsus olseni]KAF4728923.1 U1 small nuclear ribonucleoprotein 70 kDa [Perkinsus olseni]